MHVVPDALFDSSYRDLHFLYIFGLKITRFQHFTKCELSMSFRFCACVFIALHGLVTLAFDLFFFFLSLLGCTRSLRMPVLRHASQAGLMRNPREGTSVV